MTTTAACTVAVTRFLADGVQFGGGAAVYSYAPYAELFLTADPVKVAQRLPSRHLHPLRWFNGRALVIVAATDCALTIGDLPTVRYGGVYLVAIVTYGSTAAPPVLPLFGMGLPLIGDAVDRRYRPGVCFLASLTTNRVAAEVPRLWFGTPAMVAAIRHDRASDRLQVTATDPSGGHVIGIDVDTGGRAVPAEEVGRIYLVRGPDLHTQSDRIEGRLSMRWGAKGGQLRLGQHPWADQLRSLGVSTRPLLTRVQQSTGTLDQDPVRLGPADARQPDLPTEPHPEVAPLVIGHEDGHEETADQLLDRLPFTAAGEFEQVPDVDVRARST